MEQQCEPSLDCSVEPLLRVLKHVVTQLQLLYCNTFGMTLTNWAEFTRNAEFFESQNSASSSILIWSSLEIILCIVLISFCSR